MPYTMCPECGQHALKVANRCPRCGLPFEQQFLSRAQPTRPTRRLSIALLLGTVLAVLLGTAEWIQRRNAAALAGPIRDSTQQPIDIASPGQQTLQPDSHLAARSTVPQPPIDPPPARPPASATREARRPEPLARSGPAPQSGRRREARTWVNVRADPSSGSRVLGILQPGEVVEVDSVAQGWALVHSNRLPAGYVDPRLLESPPAPPTP